MHLCVGVRVNGVDQPEENQDEFQNHCLTNDSADGREGHVTPRSGLQLDPDSDFILTWTDG